MSLIPRYPARVRLFLEILIAVFLAIVTWHVSAPAAMTPAGSAISVNVGKLLGSLSSTAVGLDVSVGDQHLLDRVIPARLRQAGITMLRFPAGLTADLYHWRTHSTTRGWTAYAWTGNTFDNLSRRVARPAVARQFITVNYGSNSSGTGGGDPSEAAAWVRYANIVRHYGVKYWEIGNEVYGNGYYYYDWETDLHSRARGLHRIGNPALSPSAYALNALRYIRAMKAQDPSIKVGVGLVTPGRYPDGLSNVGGQSVQNWNPTVLSLACHAIDFVTISWYAQHAGHESDEQLLASVDQIPDVVRNVRSLLRRYCGSHASHVGLIVTETNSVNANPGKQTISPINGLFLIEDYLSWLQSGTQSVFWWELHWHANHGGNNSSRLSGHTRLGDYGLLSSGVGGEPRVNSRFPSYGALRALNLALRPGSRFVEASSSLPGVRAYALRSGREHLALILVNTTTSRAYTVSPTLFGFTPRSGSLVRYSFRVPWPVRSKLQIRNHLIQYHLNPYSAVIITISGVDTTVRHR